MAIVVLGLALGVAFLTGFALVLAACLYEPPAPPSGPVCLEGAPWMLELAETDSGVRRRRIFYGYLVMGRVSPEPEPAHWMYLESSSTVSRRQCLVTAEADGLRIHNLSQVNVTTHNGAPLWQPRVLRCGDCLGIGGRQYIVAALRYEGAMEYR